MINTILRAIVWTVARRVTNDVYNVAKKKQQQRPKKQQRKSK